jgi:esterase/lipase superfamily enzyme/lipid-binding SYLF domain-containing protein
MKKLILFFAISSLGILCWAGSARENATQRLENATNMLREIMETPDKGIPEEVLERARCIVVVPHRAKGSFIFEGKGGGEGVATCRTADGWSAPAFITISGGSWGLQIGVEAVDMIMIIQNEKGKQKLLASDVHVGADASAAAGPVGRHAEAGTDWKGDTEILTYSRAKGTFAGLTLEGASIRQDDDSRHAIYGRKVTAQSVLNGQVAVPAGTAIEFLNTVNRLTQGLASVKPPPENNYQIVRVFYATDRKQENNSEPFQYASTRSPNGELHFGTAVVSIPRDHKMGALESASFLRFEFRNDPEKHIALLNVAQQTHSKFLQDIQERVRNDPAKQVLIFVHGYNVTFEDAARRLGQITYDLGFPGAPILYSWPSKGTYLGYSADEATVEWSTPHFKAFLENVCQQTGASVIHVIAHSMGNRLLVGALSAMAAEHKTLRPTLQQVVLAAPDIDSGVFEQLAAAVSGTGSHFTIYESSTDDALKASHLLHNYVRLGDSRPDVQIVALYDTVDATDVDTGFLGHSYFPENKSILADIFYLIRGKLPSERFGVERKTKGDRVYWAVKR